MDWVVRDEVVAFRGGVAALDASVLTDRERVDLVAELERVKGAVAAAQARLTHALRRSREEADPRDVSRSVGSEVALARRCSPTLGDHFVGLARALVDEMPETLAVLSSGRCSERHAVVVARATAVLTVEDRAEVDRRVGPLLGRLGVTAAERAACRVAAELDAAAVVHRMEQAVRSRRVTVRPAPDGMAYLSVLGPLVEVVGAHAALLARARSVVGGQCPDEAPDGRGLGAVAADTALRAMSGRVAPDSVQPVEVHLVMTDRALLGTGDGRRSVMDPARVPGHGSVPAPVVRSWLRGTSHGPAEAVWLRRLYTGPDGRDLVAMDSRRRVFSGLLRRMLVLRDDVCTTPWCGAAIAHADHTGPARAGGPTSYANGRGTCARCNHVKESPGWSVSVGGRTFGARRAERPWPVRDDVLTTPTGHGERSAREVVITTPTGRRHPSTPPPLLGWGTDLHPRTAPSVRRRNGDRRPTKRPLQTSRLERMLCRYLS